MGLTVLDAGVIVAVLDAADVHHAATLAALAVARDGGDMLVIPVSAYAECLVAPSRRGGDGVTTVDRFLDALPVAIEPASRAIGAMAAGLRAEHGSALSLPDALVVATAMVLGADRVMTTDTRWPALSIRVDVLGAA